MARLLRLALLLAGLPRLPGAAEPEPARGPAYLVYAGPYSQSPSSSFGHLFLVLAEREGDPLPLWTAHTFHAITGDVDPFRYLTIGVAGGFLGRFDRFPFHQKTREYELLDDRDLWLLELRLSPEQRRALEEALERRRGLWYPYTFFRRNCAFYLQEVLSEATGALPPPGLVASPAGVFGAAAESAIGGQAHHRPSSSARIAALAAGVDPGTARRLRDPDWKAAASDQAWLEGLSARGRLLAQEVFAQRSLREEDPLPAPVREGLARLRLLAAREWAGGDGPAPPSGPGEPIAAPGFHRYPRLRALYAAGGADAGRFHLALRGAMHDGADPWTGHQPASTMELLSLELSSPLARPDLRLESAVIFSQRALAPTEWTRTRASWLLEALARTGGLFGPDAVHLEARGGLGMTARLPARTWAHALLTLAAVGANRPSAALAPGLELGLLALPASRLRLGASWAREHDLLRWSRRAERARAFARLDLSARLGLVALAEAAPGSRSVRLGLDWYP